MQIAKASDTATNANLVEMKADGTVTYQVTIATTATAKVWKSLDGVNWDQEGSDITTGTVVGAISGPVIVKIEISAWTAGAVTGVLARV